MNRLQKKCFIASAGLHGLIAAIFILSSGFISSRSKPADISTPLTFVPDILLPTDIRGGGNPKATPPPPSAPPQVAAPVQHQDVVEKAAPESPKPREPQIQPTPPEDPGEASLERKHKVEVSTTLKTRPPRTTKKPSSTTSDTASEQAEAAAQRREMANRIGRAVADIGQASSAMTSIEDFGPGGGGPAYAGYAAYVQAIYLAAWVPPDNASVDAAIAKATITIARDGTIISHSLTTRSGEGAIDSSILRALERVTTIGRPFPEGMNDKERTYILKFDLTVKRQA